MYNNDLTQFNLSKAFMLIDIVTNRKDIYDFSWSVVIFNFNDNVAFAHTHEFNCPTKAEAFADTIKARNIVNLTLWNASDFLTYTTRDDYYGPDDSFDEEMPLHELLKTDFGKQF